jgi:ribosome-associated protein
VVLDVGDVLAITDWFVIATGGNPRQVRTIADEVATAVEAEGAPPPRVEGRDDATWVLLDFGDLVVHVFQPETRSYYTLERLWADVPRLDWTDDLDPRAVAQA